MPEIVIPDGGAARQQAGHEPAVQAAEAQTAVSLSVINTLLPDLQASLDKGDVSFDQLCEAYFGRHDGLGDRRLAYEQLYPQIQAAYDRKHGTTTTYFTEPGLNLRAGIAFSKGVGTDQLALVYDPGLAPSNTLYLLGWLDKMNIESRTLLTDNVLTQYNELAYAAGSNVLAVMEYQKKAGTDIGQEDLSNRIKVLESTLNDAEAFSTRNTQTIARSIYSEGMLKGLVALAAVALTLIWLLPAFGWLGSDDARFIFFTMLTGGVGAVVSVMARSASLNLPSEVGKSQLRYFGLYRPIVGGIFGFILCALIRSKVVNFVAIPDQAQAIYYYVTVAFLGGFSERLVPGILESAERRFSVSGSTRRTAHPPK
jgi:hypothetical protein